MLPQIQELPELTPNEEVDSSVNQQQISEEEKQYQDWVNIVNGRDLKDNLDRDLKLQSSSIPKSDLARSNGVPSLNANEIDELKADAGLNKRSK